MKERGDLNGSKGERKQRERASKEQEGRKERKLDGKVASLGFCARNYLR